MFGAASLLFQHEGFPEILQSDNGSEFVAEVVELLLTECGVKIKHGKPRHPQSQGQIENLNKQFKNNMRKAIGHMDPTQQAMAWPLLLPRLRMSSIIPGILQLMMFPLECSEIVSPFH